MIIYLVLDLHSEHSISLITKRNMNNSLNKIIKREVCSNIENIFILPLRYFIDNDDFLDKYIISMDVELLDFEIDLLKPEYNIEIYHKTKEGKRESSFFDIYKNHELIKSIEINGDNFIDYYYRIL